jgi:hypothetical protein
MRVIRAGISMSAARAAFPEGAEGLEPADIVVPIASSSPTAIEIGTT